MTHGAPANGIGRAGPVDEAGEDGGPADGSGGGVPPDDVGSGNEGGGRANERGVPARDPVEAEFGFEDG